MGYSATKKAFRTWDHFTDACDESTGMNNTFQTPRGKYFIEIGNEQSDGAMTGSLYKIQPNGMARRTSGIRINPDGTVATGPAFLKRCGAWASQEAKFQII